MEWRSQMFALSPSDVFSMFVITLLVLFSGFFGTYAVRAALRFGAFGDPLAYYGLGFITFACAAFNTAGVIDTGFVRCAREFGRTLTFEPILIPSESGPALIMILTASLIVAVVAGSVAYVFRSVFAKQRRSCTQ